MDNILTNSITKYGLSGQHNYYVAQDVDSRFSSSVQESAQHVSCFSTKASNAVSKLDNVIILKDSKSEVPEGFERTDKKLHKHAEDAFGFVSKPDDAVVIIQDNHGRKDERLEGNIYSQGADTFSHEVGHLLDEEYSQTEAFQAAYLQDLMNIEAALKDPNSKVCGEDLREMLVYLKHYTEGADFSDGIDESDVTREGLRENFAECFSTMADSNPSKINQIYAALFPNTMATTREFVI